MILKCGHIFSMSQYSMLNLIAQSLMTLFLVIAEVYTNLKGVENCNFHVIILLCRSVDNNNFIAYRFKYDERSAV